MTKIIEIIEFCEICGSTYLKIIDEEWAICENCGWKTKRKT